MAIGKTHNGTPFAGNLQVSFDEAVDVFLSMPGRGEQFQSKFGNISREKSFADFVGRTGNGERRWGRRCLGMLARVVGVSLFLTFGNMAHAVVADSVISSAGYYTGTVSANQNRLNATKVVRIEVPTGYRAEVTAMQTDKRWMNADRWTSSIDVGGNIKENPNSNLTKVTAVFYSAGYVTIESIVRPAAKPWPLTGVYEYYYCDVDYSITVSYERLLPDLQVSSLSLVPSPAATDEAISLSCTIRNGGSRALDVESKVSVYVDGVRIGDESPVGALGAGGSVTKTIVLPKFVAGNHTVKVVADAISMIDELDRGNNERTDVLMVYERVPYSVRFDPNGGNGTMPDQSFVAGTEQALRPNVFTRTDYLFKGWATNATGAVVVADSSQQKALAYRRGDIVTLYAVWEAFRRTITFDANGGTVSLDSLTCSAATPCGDLPMAQREGHDFIGWFTERDGGVQIFPESIVKFDCTLYAHYEHMIFSVHFDANGGTGEMPDVIATKGTATSLPRNQYTRRGYFFGGWRMGPRSSDSFFSSDGAVCSVNANMTLYADWIAECNHTYRFEANGGEGSMSDIVVANRERLTLPDCAFSKEGCVFWGWESNTVGDVTTYTAKWKQAVMVDTSERGGMVFATDGDSHWYASEYDGKDVVKCEITNAVVYITNRYNETTYYIASRDANLRLRFPEEDGLYFYKFNWIYPDGMHYCWSLDLVYYTGNGWVKNFGNGFESQTPHYWDGYLYTGVDGGGRDWQMVSAEQLTALNEKYPPFCYRSIYKDNNTLKPDGVIVCLDPGVFVRQAYEFSESAIVTNIVVSPSANWEAQVSEDWLSLEGGYQQGKLKLEYNDSMYSRSAMIYVKDRSNSDLEVNYSIIVNQAAGIKYSDFCFNVQGGEMVTNVVRYALGRTFTELPVPTRFGYAFAGWFTTPKIGGTEVTEQTIVGEGRTLYARWNILSAVIHFDGNGGTCLETEKTYFHGSTLGGLPTATRTGYVFGGWTTVRNGGCTVMDDSKVAGDTVLYAYWLIPATKVEDRGDAGGNPLNADEDPLGGGDTPMSRTAALTYDGYLRDANGNVKGTIQVKVGKPNAKTGLAAVKATVVGLDGMKKNLKASRNGKAAIAANGPTTVSLAGGDVCSVTLSAKDLSGTYGSYTIDGALNVFASKDAADKTAATAALGKWQGAVNVAWESAQGWNGLSVTIVAKGKAKVSGTLADGTKVSAKGQLIVGEEWCCIPVVSKKGQLAFNVWLPKVQGGDTLPTVAGIAGAVVGKPGTLAGGATFRLGASMGDAKYDAYLPDGLAVGGGAKWTLPKAGKVQLAKNGAVDASKLGENPSALKLTYKAKDGSFKGSFKVYADVVGKPKSTTVKVVGVLVNGVGYGTATVKGGRVPVTVE